jgi:UDP-GlcNAc:undecaprenyl-phosphate GlcNAc-1-phosphate transferase
MVFALGLLDDLFDLNALVKLAGQIVAACVVAASGLLVTHFGSPFFNFEVELGLAAYPVTVFYLVAFANIINLIDGLDGLAAGIVTISAVTLLVLSLEKGGMDAVVLALAAIGACLAFLRFNFHPAKTYMGDGGALLLGMTLGVISLMGIVRTPALISILVPVAIAFIPVIDTFSAIVRRIRLRQPIMKADVAHIHHRFMRAGFNQRSTVLIIYGVDALLALCAWLIVGVTGVWRIALSVFLAALALLLVWILGLHESVLQHFYYKRPAHRPPSGDDGDGDAGAETAIERGREIGSAD